MIRAAKGDDRERSSSLSSKLSARDLVRVPGLLSLSRIVLAALFPLVLGRVEWSLAILVIAGVTDVLDGWYARRFHQQTATGALVDGVADKVFILAIALSLLLSHRLAPIELLLLATRDIGELALVIRLGIAHRTRFVTPSANAAGKIATILQYAAVVAILVGSGQRAVFIGAAALAGVLASLSYWHRDVEATRAT